MSNESSTPLRRLHDRLGSMIDQVGQPDYSLRGLVNGLREVRDELLLLSEMRPIAAPTDEEVAAYRDLFRSELDKNMHNSSSSPSTDAHRVALHRFVEARNGKRTVR